MFCSKCGTKLIDNGACPSCGDISKNETQSGNARVTDMTIAQIGDKVTSSIKGVKIEGSDEDNIAFNVSGKKAKFASIIKVTALVLCLMFFFPMFAVSCSNAEVNFSAFDTTFGKTVHMENMGMGSQRVDGNIFAIFLLLIPIAIFLAVHLKKMFPTLKDRLYKVLTGFSALGIIMLFIYKGVVDSKVKEEMLTAEFKGTFGFSILLYLIIGAISMLGYYVLNMKDNPSNTGEARKSE